MGITWSTPREVKNGTLIVLSTDFPNDKYSSKQIWSLWKIYKERIKKDGFTIAKFNNKWKISYFVHKTPQCENEIDGEKSYIVEFKQKYNKWYQSLKKMTSVNYKEAQQEDNAKLYDEIANKHQKSSSSNEVSKSKEKNENQEQNFFDDQDINEEIPMDLGEPVSDKVDDSDKIESTDELEKMLDVWDDLKDEQ